MLSAAKTLIAATMLAGLPVLIVSVTSAHAGDDFEYCSPAATSRAVADLGSDRHLIPALLTMLHYLCERRAHASSEQDRAVVEGAMIGLPEMLRLGDAERRAALPHHDPGAV